MCFQARRADRILTRLYDSFIKRTGLKSTQYGLLRCISNFVNPCVADISAAMCMDQTTVSRNLNVLQKGGYIETSISAADPRRTDIAITRFGHEKMREAEMAWERAQQSVKESLGEEDFDQLHGLLEKVVDALDCDG